MLTIPEVLEETVNVINELELVDHPVDFTTDADGVEQQELSKVTHVCLSGAVRVAAARLLATEDLSKTRDFLDDMPNVRVSGRQDTFGLGDLYMIQAPLDPMVLLKEKDKQGLIDLVRSLQEVR